MAKANSVWLDIRRMHFYLDLYGETFSPKLAEKKTGLILHEKLERGEPCNHLSPRHPGFRKPCSIGSAILQAPGNIPEGKQSQWVLQALARHSRTFRRLGASDITFWEVHFLRHGAQENFELSVADMKLLSHSKIPYCLSVYHLNKKELMTMSERLYSRLAKSGVAKSH